jgi:hypothetical protein
MAHILECSPFSAGSLVGGNGSLLQARQVGQHCWRVWQPAFLTDRQRKFGKLHRISVSSYPHNSPLPGTDSKHSGQQQKHRRNRRTTRDESPLKKGLVVVQSSLDENAPPTRTLSSRILPGLPAAAVFFATGLARAAEEIELPPSVVPNDDEISNSIIAVLFTLGLVALSILTLGVSCTP